MSRVSPKSIAVPSKIWALNSLNPETMRWNVWRICFIFFPLRFETYTTQNPQEAVLFITYKQFLPLNTKFQIHLGSCRVEALEGQVRCATWTSHLSQRTSRDVHDMVWKPGAKMAHFRQLIYGTHSIHGSIVNGIKTYIWVLFGK